jgi:hypothetical protein
MVCNGFESRGLFYRQLALRDACNCLVRANWSALPHVAVAQATTAKTIRRFSQETLSLQCRVEIVHLQI